MDQPIYYFESPGVPADGLANKIWYQVKNGRVVCQSNYSRDWGTTMRFPNADGPQQLKAMGLPIVLSVGDTVPVDLDLYLSARL